MSMTKTEFTIEKAKNGYILDNENTGKNVFLEKKDVADFIAKSLTNSLSYNDGKAYNIKIEIEKPTLKNK